MRTKEVIVLWLLLVSMASARHDLTKIVSALIQVESEGITNAVNGNAVGILQIKPITVREVNRILKGEVYTLADRYSPEKSKDMAMVFFTYWVKRWPSMSDKELCGRWMMPNGKAPEWYKVRCAKELQ